MSRYSFVVRWFFMFATLWVFLAFTGIVSSVAQEATSIKEVVEAETVSQEIIDATLDKLSRDPLNRTTPRSALIGIRKRIQEGDFEEAVEFLDMRYLPETIKLEDGPRLVRQLQFIFSRNVWLDIASVSDKHEGDLDDGLPSYRDLLGRVETGEGFVDLYMQRVPDKNADFIWKISNATVAKIPELWEEFGYSDFEIKAGEMLPHFRALHMENWQWTFLIVFSILAWIGVTVIVVLLNKLIQRRSKVYTDAMIHFFRGSGRIFLFMISIVLFIPTLNLSLRAKVIFESGVWTYIACIWLILGLVDLLRIHYILKLKKTGSEYAAVLIRPITIVIKAILIIVLVLLGLENAGYDMTTIIAGLGVTSIAIVLVLLGLENAGYDMTTIIAGLGVTSIAIALAAQKTLENVFGAFTLYIARPVKPGDFCRFGTIRGIVEDIGLRSTEIRTLNRTLVSIPNSVFSSGEIENYTARDRYRYLRTVRLRLDTTTDQLRYLLVELRKLLYAHPMTYKELVRVRFTDVDEYSIDLRVETNLMANDFSEYLQLAEDLNLRLVDIVREAGTWFAVPTRTIKMETAEEFDGERRAEVEEIVSQWRKTDQLPFPELSDEEIGKLDGSLDYPPKGSQQAQKE